MTTCSISIDCQQTRRKRSTNNFFGSIFLIWSLFVTASRSENESGGGGGGGEYIAFPEMVEDIMQLPIDNRTALTMPQVCGENEWYFPTKQVGVYVCDCIPGFIYHPDEAKCFAAYRRGPCKLGELIALGADGFTPTCIHDRCAESGLVTFGKDCVRLGDPCDVDTRRRYEVNETTIVVECLQVSRFYQDPAQRRPSLRPSPTTTTQAPTTTPITKKPVSLQQQPSAITTKRPTSAPQPLQQKPQTQRPPYPQTQKPGWRPTLPGKPFGGWSQQASASKPVKTVPVVRIDSHVVCTPGCKRLADGTCPEPGQQQQPQQPQKQP